jgi:predicted ArsR family transcriptional regulator
MDEPRERQLPGGDEPSRLAALLETLQRRGPLTAEAVATAVGLSRTAVTRQLAALGRKGLVERRAIRGGVGRPRYSYDVTPAAQGFVRAEYEAFSMALLEAVADVGGGELVERLFEAWRRRVGTGIRERFRDLGIPDDALADRLRELAARQDAEGFAADVSEQRGLRLRQHACPLRRVAGLVPSLCEAELHLYADVLGADVERESLIAAGARTCSYRVRPRPRDFPGPQWRTVQMRAAFRTPLPDYPAEPAPTWSSGQMRAAPARPAAAPPGRVVPWPAAEPRPRPPASRSTGRDR